MEARLQSISRALAQSAINGYNCRASFMYAGHDSAVSRVYEELLIGARKKCDVWTLSRNIARVALIAYWQSTRPYVDNMKLTQLDNEYPFRQARMATHATLKKMIKQTNYERRLNGRLQTNLLSF